jgi:hypothetical protein
MQNADTVRNLAIMQATEPGTYKQKLSNAQQMVGSRRSSSAGHHRRAGSTRWRCAR